MSDGRLRRPGVPVVGRVAAAILVLLFGLPVLALLGRALVLQGGLLAALSDPAIGAALAVSLVTTAISLAVTVVLGTPLAYALATRDVPAGRLVETIVDLPIVLPPSVAGLALLLLFGRRGPLAPILDPLGLDLAFTTAAGVLAQLFVSAPLYVRSVRTGFRAIGPATIEAAQVDGAGDWSVFWRIAVPLATGAIGSGAVLAWVRALGEFGATIMFAGSLQGVTQTLPLAIYTFIQTPGGDADALRLTVVATAIALFALIASELIQRRAERHLTSTP